MRIIDNIVNAVISSSDFRWFHGLGIVCIVMFGVILWEVYPLGLFLLLSLSIIALFVYRFEWGMYALAATSFFHEWEIDFSHSQRLRELPYIPQINAPVADIIGVFLGIVFIISLLFHRKRIPWKELFHLRYGFLIYAGFLVAAAVSAIFFMYNNFYTAGIKYWLRPMLFTWLVYWFMPVVAAIDMPKIIRKILAIWFTVGIVIALYGVASFFVLDQTEWIRALPFSINGFAPLGYNHNQMAEALVAILPIGVWFALTHKDIFARKLAGYASILIAVIALLTLSRAAWIAIVCETIILGVYLYRLRGKRMSDRRLIGSLLLALAPVLIYMATFLTSSVVMSSNSARLDAAKIAAFYATQSPYFGYGPGSFVWLLTDTTFYTMEYGDPLEAHGFVQKILVEDGAIGLVLFVAFLSWVLWYVWTGQERKQERELAIMLFIMAAGTISFQVFNTSYFNSVMWMPLGVATAGALLIKHKEV